jgi:hypothetical protein
MNQEDLPPPAEDTAATAPDLYLNQLKQEIADLEQRNSR